MASSENREIVIKALEKALQKPVDRAAIHDGMDLKEDLNVDSLSMIETVWDVEEKLGIHIDENEMKKIRTVGDVFATIDSLVSAKAA